MEGTDRPGAVVPRPEAVEPVGSEIGAPLVVIEMFDGLRARLVGTGAGNDTGL